MADPAPFSVNRPPYPNVHLNLNGRVEQYLISALGANGSVALVDSASSAGCDVAYVAEGEYTVTFPAGGTGAIGFVQILPVEVAGQTAGDARAYAIDSDDLDFETGTCTFLATTVSGGSEALADIIGTFRVLVSVVKAVS